MGLPDGWSLTSAYGTYTTMRDNSGKIKIHRGLDFAASSGTPIRAANGGVVSLSSGYSGGYGNTIKIKTSSGLYNRYGHMTGFASGLKSGDTVSTGQLIGYVGSTGHSTGPHLHFQVNKTDNERDDINPWPYVRMEMFGGKGGLGIMDTSSGYSTTGDSGTIQGNNIPVHTAKFVPKAFQFGSETGVGGMEESVSKGVNSGIDRLIGYLDGIRSEQNDQRKILEAFSKSRTSESTY